MATLFDIGTTADFSSTVVSDGTISDSSGKIAIAITSASTAARYGVKTFTAVSTDDFRMRWYFEVGTLAMSSNNAHNFIEIFAASDAVRRVELRMQNQAAGAGFELRLNLFSDNDTQNTSSYTVLGATWPEFAEIWVQKASNGTGANDGRIDLYFDGSETPTLSVTGVDIFDHFDFDEVRIGHVSLVDAALTGTMFLDNIKATDTADVIGAASVAPSATVPGDGICINIYGETAVAGISVTEGTSSIVSVVTTSTAGSTLTYDTTGTSVTISGNGTNAATLLNGASEAEYNTVLGTLTMRGTTVDTTITVTVIPTDGTLNDNETFDVFCDPNSLTATGANADVIAWAASLQVRILVGQTNDTISVHIEDDTGGTPLEVDSAFVAALAVYFQTGDGDLPLLASTRGITDVIM